uniref:Ig-like domain-containing protein n=1 Tax=Methanobrevibacter sp. TaxID=66852 RepID=UPI0038704F19
VVMKVKGKSYNVKTDAKGYATKTFDFTPGKYTITATYKGSTVKNTITIKKVLKANSATMKKAKKIKYSATLKTSKGKAISGKKITFKINGKTYSAKTNKKGIATVSFKNLKVGKYSVVVKYLKSQVKTTLKIKK